MLFEANLLISGVSTAAFSAVFTPQEGVTHFKVAQLLENDLWLNWTVGDSTAKPVNLSCVTKSNDMFHYRTTLSSIIQKSKTKAS